MKNRKLQTSGGSRHRKDAETRIGSESSDGGRESAGHARILLVDDDPGVRGSLTEVLASEGYIVVPAGDGLHALELAAEKPFDLVLLDLNMPRKNGWDTFERMSVEHPLLPIIIITARPNQLFTAASAGVGALLEKPMDIPVLLVTIRRLLAEPDTERLARLAGQHMEFHYAAPSRPDSEQTAKSDASRGADSGSSV